MSDPVKPVTSANPDLPQMLNFDLLECHYVDVQKTVSGELRAWHLRDDVPASKLLGAFRLQELVAAMSKAADAAAGEEAFARLEAKTYELAAVIFRHTYPDASDPTPHPAMQADLRAAFPYEQVNVIVTLFFTRRFPASSAPSSATPPSSASAMNSTARDSKTSSKRTSTARNNRNVGSTKNTSRRT